MKIRWFVIVFLLVILVLTLATGSTMLWRLFIFMIALLFMSFYWMRMNIRAIDSRVGKFSQYCRVGDRFEVELVFTNDGKLPTALIEVKEDNELAGTKRSFTFHLPAKGSYSWNLEGICRRRGLYDMGNLTVKITDPLGFFTVKERIKNTRRITVFPTTIDLPFFQVLPRQEVGTSKRRWFTSEAGTNAARVRDYLSGDSLRSIHWHTTAHTGQLMVKEFDPELSNYSYKDIWIVLDMQSGSHFGEGDENTEEYAVNIASSLVKKFVDGGKNVGLMSSGERPFLFLPDTGDEHLQEMMRALAVIEADSKLSLGALLESQEERFEPGCAIVIISPSGNIQNALRRMVHRGTVVTAVLLDAASFGGTVNAGETARSLISAGIHAYIIRRGDEIVRALDSRYLLSPVSYTGTKR